MSARRLLVLMFATTLGLTVLVAPASAATKPFSMVVSPASVPAGQSTFSVTLTNHTSPQQLGSADITVPSAFTAVSVADPGGPATATTDGNVVQLRDASLAPGASIVLSVSATVPSACGATYTWSVVAKQANDFNGPPGNDLTLDPSKSSLTTTVSCGGGQQVTVPCIENVTCSATIVNGTTTFQVTAPGNNRIDAGLLTLTNGGTQIDCRFDNLNDYVELTATPTVVEGPDRAKVVTSTIDKSAMNRLPNNGASFLQMCFGAPYTFPTRPGTPLTGIDTDGIPGPDFFVGLLPDCGVAPCVSSRNKTKAGDGVIVVQAPGGTKDPAYRP
jgi:hypothetical protein